MKAEKLHKGKNMNTKNKTAERLIHASAAANLKHHTYYLGYIRPTQGRFNRFYLPSPIKVLHQLGFVIEKTNSKGYLKLRCPFHKDGNEKTPSLNLHNTSGHYRCHACGAKGKDILAFYMNLTGKSFVEAAKELGAWEVKHDR